MKTQAEPMAGDKAVFIFGDGSKPYIKNPRYTLGNKGAGLFEMSSLGIPVPPGFTISTQASLIFYKNDMKTPQNIDNEMLTAIKQLEKLTGKQFGSGKNPLLVSVRSGAPVSMPGMMDTILNVGLNDDTVKSLARSTTNEAFAYDSYRRLIMMFGNVVMQVQRNKFEEAKTRIKKSQWKTTDQSLDPASLKQLVDEFKQIFKKETGTEFPQDAIAQVRMARDAVFKSWNNKRAVEYRRLYKIPDCYGTAVTVQTMVFGNMGDDSGTGVGFTRSPSTGEKKIYGEYLNNAQGEDVVAGIRTPSSIDTLPPESASQLTKIVTNLERYYKDIQDFEFTIERKKLYLLQTRSGKRTGQAALKIACDMVSEKLITPREAVQRLTSDHFEQILHPVFDPKAVKKFDILAKGLNASPGAASGRIFFDADEAVKVAKKGERVVLVRPETSAEDIHGMAAANGVLTAVGGYTSHAAVVCRQMGKPSIVGCSKLVIDEKTHTAKVGNRTLKQGEYISVNGTTGEVLLGDVPSADSEIIRVLRGELKASQSELYKYYSMFMQWVDSFRKLRVRANADTPQDANLARLLGAEGIGLCRTEHMFFAKERLPIFQKMIIANTIEAREKALNQLLPYQKDDFTALFKAMGEFPVTIRTIDPPLHEFLPPVSEVKDRKILERIKELHEFNPMMGHRGCRLGITMPEITVMQARAILMAAKEVKGNILPEIMIPIVGHVNEFENQKLIVDRVAKELSVKNYLVGTMIEIPRAAIKADEIAKRAEFFSFGTNDLTQMTFGFSRDDAGRFLNDYLEKKILPHDPFQSIDQSGVGELMSIAVNKGRGVKKDLKIGICGEHGGECESVKFCHRIGLDYVSCSPYRIPGAKLAAAHAALE